MSKIEIRPGRIADAPFIAKGVAMAIGDESIRFYCGEDYLSVLEGIAALEISQYSYRNALIAEADGLAVGVAVSYDGGRLEELRTPTLRHIFETVSKNHQIPDETGPGELYLDTLAVLPGFRGKGIGGMLIEATKERAKDLGLPAVGLLVDFDNATAQKLYAGHGFTQAGDGDFLGHPMHHLSFQVRS